MFWVLMYYEMVHQSFQIPCLFLKYYQSNLINLHQKVKSQGKHGQKQVEM